MEKLRKINVFFCSAILALTLATTLPTVAVASDDVHETTIQPKIKLIGAFKNGIGVVAEDYEVSALGRFVAAQPPSPLHGSFFVESDAVVETSANFGDVEIPINQATDFNWATDLKDTWLRLRLPGNDEQIVAKVVYATNSTNNPTIDYSMSARSTGVYRTNSGVFVETKEGKKIWIANPYAVDQVQIEEGDLPAFVTRQRDRLVFTVKKLPESGSATIRLFYMTQGLCWSPQYRVDLVDSTKLNIEQNAILVNEWRDFKDAPVSLYSGFPQIAFQNVASLMAPGATLQAFLSSLSNPGDGGGFRRSSVLTQQAITLNNAAMGGGLYGNDMNGNVSISADTESVKDGIDVYSQNVGEKTLSKNDRTMFLVDKKAADYKRVVYWRIGSTRTDEYNNLSRSIGDGVPGSYGRTTSGSNATQMAIFSEPWDVLEFKNPFDFPITTGAASVTSGTQFLGQNTLYWTNPGETTILPITKALSVRVMSSELERDLNTQDASDSLSAIVAKDSVVLVIERNSFVPDFEKAVFVEKNWGRVVKIYGSFYRLAVVDVTIDLKNQRDEETEMKISQPIVGKLVDGSVNGFEPQVLRLSDRILRPYANFYNPLYELNSTVTLKPRESRTLTFSYQILLPQ